MDKIYLVKLSNSNKIRDYRFCYDTNEISSFLTTRVTNNISTFSCIRVPKAEQLSIEDILNNLNFDISIETYTGDDKTNRIYFSYVYLRINNKPIIYINNCKNLKVSIQDACSFFKNTLEKIYNKNLSNKDIDYIIDNDIMEHSIQVLIFHKHRIRFDTATEIREYYINNIFDISKNHMYDFLLSMIDHDERNYTYNGDFIASRNRHQLLGDNDFGYMELPLFNIENAESLYVYKHKIIK